MIGAIERLRWRFRDQFTQTEQGWVYRSRSRGPALPLGDHDHAALVVGFDRATRWTAWSGVPVAALIWGLLNWYDLHPSYWAVAVPFVAAFGAVIWWAWRAPNRLLDGRAPVAPALTTAQSFGHNMRTLPWAVLVLGALLSVTIVARPALGPAPWSVENRGTYAYGAVLLVFFIGMAVAKRRSG